MSKSHGQSSADRSARYQLRAQRGKTAALVFAALAPGVDAPELTIERATHLAKQAVLAADILLAELARTQPESEGS